MLQVHVEPALPPDPLTATATGSDTWSPDGETEQTGWFGVTAANLRRAIDAFTPGLGDLVDRIDFSGDGYLVDTSLNVFGDSPPKGGASIVAAASGKPKVAVARKPAIINRVPLHNGTDEEQEFDVAVSLARSDSVSSEWGKSTTIGASTTVEVSVGVEGVGGGKASATVSYEQESSESHGVSRQLDTGVEVSVHAHLKPGERAVAGVTAWRGTVDTAVPVRASISGYVTLHIRPRHWWILPVVKDIPTSGLKRGDQVHVTVCTVPLTYDPTLGPFHREGLLNAWSRPDLGIHLRAHADDTYHLSTAEWVDAEAEVVTVTDDTETAILGAAEKSLESRTGSKEQTT